MTMRANSKDRPTRPRTGLMCLLVVGVTLVIASSAVGQVIKLATLVPDRSVWGNPLRDMGAAWQEQTAGRVS
jgi:TRAP-type C4-dicarboxylate transport system substrate-binding protein